MNVTLTPSQMWIPGFTDRYFWDFSTEAVYSCVYPGSAAPYCMKYSTNDYVGLRPNPRTDRYASTQHFTRDDLKSLMNAEFKKRAVDIINQRTDISNEATASKPEQPLVADQSSFYVFNTQTGIVVGRGEYEEMVHLAKRITLNTGNICELLRKVAVTVPFEIKDVNMKVLT